MVSSKCFRVISRQSFFGRLKKCLKKLIKENQQQRSQCHRFETRSEQGERKGSCLQVSRKRRKEEQRWWLGKCLNWVTVTICNGKRATKQVCRPFFSVFWIRQINKIPLCLEQVFSVMDHRRRQNVCGSCAKTHFNIICDWLLNRHTAKRNQVVNCLSDTILWYKSYLNRR